MLFDPPQSGAQEGDRWRKAMPINSTDTPIANTASPAHVSGASHIKAAPRATSPRASGLRRDGFNFMAG